MWTNENGKAMDSVISRTLLEFDENIEQWLQMLPIDLYEADLEVARLTRELNESQEDLEIAETNALLAATIDGKNEEQRKLQRAAVLNTDAQVGRCKSAIKRLTREKDEQTAKAEMLRRRFASVCYLAQLRAAQLQVMARGH